MSLPDDVWHRIATFLVEKDLRRLYPVNRAFYEIVMALRHAEVSVVVYRLAGSEGGGLERLNYYQLSDPTYGVFRVEDYTPELTRFMRMLKISFSSRKFHLQELAQVIKLEEWELEEIAAEEELPHFDETGTCSPHARADTTGPRKAASVVTAPGIDRSQRCARAKLMTLLKNLFASSKNTHSPPLPTREEIRSGTVAGRQGPNDRRAHNLLEFICSLTKLENLAFEWIPTCGTRDDCNAISWYLPPLYRSTLEASGDGSLLRSLTLNVEMGCWRQFLRQSLMFERLERFTVYCRSGWCCCGEAASVLVPFIQRHGERLRELVVVSKECQLGGLWSEVGFIPGLRKLEVEETPRRCDPSRDGGNLWGFLEMHSQILTHLIWKLSDANLALTNTDLGIWFSKDRELIHFPHLKTLELQGLQQLPPYLFFGPVLRYLGTLQASLTALKIHGWRLTPEPSVALLEAIASPLITVLDVGLEKLTSDLFMEMEILVPNLRVLKIVYREAVGIWGGEGPQDSSFLLPGNMASSGRSISEVASTMGGKQSRTTLAVGRFIRDMEQLYFTEWPVEELVLRCTRIDRLARDPQWRAKRAGIAVLSTLPSVTVINGVAREEYSREVEENKEFIPELM